MALRRTSDFWNLSGPPDTDFRAVAYAFYFQLFVWLALLAFEMRHLVTTRRQGPDDRP